MRGVESLAYDLDVQHGRVSGRVALLLRSAERNPSAARFDFGRNSSKVAHWGIVCYMQSSKGQLERRWGGDETIEGVWYYRIGPRVLSGEDLGNVIRKYIGAAAP